MVLDISRLEDIDSETSGDRRYSFSFAICGHHFVYSDEEFINMLDARTHTLVCKMEHGCTFRYGGDCPNVRSLSDDLFQYTNCGVIVVFNLKTMKHEFGVKSYGWSFYRLHDGRYLYSDSKPGKTVYDPYTKRIFVLCKDEALPKGATWNSAGVYCFAHRHTITFYW